MNPENSIEKLEEISTKLNNENLEINEALNLFEEGVNIIKQDYETIKKAKGRVVELKKELDKYSEVKFDEV